MAKLYYGFMIDPELADALKRMKERDGVPEGEQIRRALREWYRRKGIEVKPAAKAESGRPRRRDDAKKKNR